MSIASSMKPSILLSDVKSAMDNINRSNSVWWQDSETCNIINFAVQEGWVVRPSVTQVEWTEFGVMACQLTA